MSVPKQAQQEADVDAIIAVLDAYSVPLREITDIVASLILLRCPSHRLAICVRSRASVL